MLLMKIIFAALIIICSVFYVMYLWNFALVLLVIMIAVPVVMFLITFLASRKMSVEMTLKNTAAAKNENFPVQIKVNNRSIIPIGKADVHIHYYNVFNNQINTFQLFMPIQAKNVQSVTFQLSSKFCGIVNIFCKQIYIYDPLRIFKFRIGRNVSVQAAVMPEGHEIEGIVNFTDRVNEESESFSEHKPGDDPSEVFDLRGYHPGDKLNRIHWKLSSKKDEFIVKDYSLPVDIPCLIFIDLHCYEDSKYTLPVFDTLMESLVSLSQFLISNERAHTIVYYSGRRGEFVEKNITDPESMTIAIQEIVLSVSDNLFCEQPENYFRLCDNDLSLSSFTFITSSSDQRIIEYIDDNVDADFKNCVAVVKTPEDAEKMNADYSSLSMIPVVIGRVSASIKDIEI